MGVDKATLRYRGEPQVRRLAKFLSRITPEVFVSVRPAQVGDPAFRGLSLLPDEEMGIGPLAGLLSAFRHRPRAAWLAVAVDMPGVTLGTLRRLVRARDSERLATAYKSPLTGAPEPVCAIYEPAILPALLEAKARDRYSLMLLKTLSVRLVEPAAARELLNVNERREYSLWGERHGE
jgi:molybdopterin-guanine dinucleotide biosynthesis protein A